MRDVAVLGLVIVLLAASGCGGKGPSAEESAPFAAAIGKYLADQSMGMKVDSFKSLKITGDEARAEVYMSDKDVGYGMKPLWTFTFDRSGGGWKVRSVDR